MFTQIYTQYWISLPKEVREHLVSIFDIPRSGITEIRDQTVLSDGHTNEDLKAISAERMGAYTGDTTAAFPMLWELTIVKAFEDLAQKIVDAPEAEIAAPRYCMTCTAKSGRHKKGCPKYK